jgi:hypothetical protein
MNWQQAREELMKANAVHRTSWLPDDYLDTEYAGSTGDLRDYPLTDPNGNACRLVLWTGGNDPEPFTPSEADKSATDWALA